MLESGLPENVNDDEELARFVTSSKFLRGETVKPAAFLPNPKTNDTSVFRHGPGAIEKLKRLGETLIADKRKVHGIAFVTAGTVRYAGLDVIASEPPPRHANIVHWPSSDSDPQLAKAQCKERALVLAGAARVLAY